MAEDLAPADTALLDLDKVQALVTIQGGPTSHTAILAREKSITAIVGVADAAELTEDEQIIVDSVAGIVYTQPSAEQIRDAQARRTAREEEAAAPLTPGTLADGTAVPLLANLGSASSTDQAVELGAEGVGLFRTEFLFLSADEAPRWRSSGRPTRRSSRRSPARRWSCGRSMPAPTSR